LDEAVPPFDNTPRDWNGVLARSAELRAGRHHVATLGWHRRALVGAVPAIVIALWLSLLVAFAPGRSSTAGSPSPPEIWKAIAASPSFAGNPEIFGIRGEFSEWDGDPYGELTVSVGIRAATGTRALGDPRGLSAQRANWLALTAAAIYENESRQAGRKGLSVIVSEVESKNPDGTVALSRESHPANVSGAGRAIIAPADLLRARGRVLARGKDLPNVKSLSVSLPQFGHSAAAEVRVVTDDPDGFFFTYPRLSKILSDGFSSDLVGTKLEVYDTKGDPVLFLSDSSLLREGSVIGFRPWVSYLTGINLLPPAR
jgi:hypothetical protein